jgi:hypothetical protein
MISRKQIIFKSIYPSMFTTLIFILFTLFITLSMCTQSWGEKQFSKEEAAQKVLSTIVEKIWEKADKRKGLRVHQHIQLLPKGTRVQPAFVPEGKEPSGTECKNPCWLFFIDEDPRAHFAHPVRIVLIDSMTGEQQVISTEWWPLIDGKPIFSTVKERSDPKTIIFDKVPDRELRSEKQKEVIGGASGKVKMHDPCSTWAIIVCGYDDLPDTFDEDTDGIYNVLIGLGVPDDHIFFVSPHTTHTGVDQPTSIANVQWAINQVAAQADETDKVLFFYSSHGGVDSLLCVPGSPGGGYISGSDLRNWLSAITSQELVIVIEACHSGSLIGRYADGTYVAAEDDLTGHGETNRAVFTSASSDTSSYADEDGPDDPNPGDSGSETIWGYVEAFGTASADLNTDGEISFGEAWQYAWNNDVTRIRGWNTPQMVHTGLNANNVYNYCYKVSGSRDLFVADGPGDVGHNSYDYNSTDIWVTQDPAETDHQDVVSGMDNFVHVAVHNRGTTSITNGSLKVYWGDVSTATSWPSDFHQIGSTHTFSSLATGDTLTHTWTWYVDPAIGLGHHFCLIAVSDSPDDPMTGGPAGITYVAPYDNNIGQKNITIIEDPGHGKGAFKFILKNNTRNFDSVDLVIEWVGKPWGSAILILPEDLSEFVKEEKIKLENLKIVDVPEKKTVGLEVTGKTEARISGIPLKPGDSRTVSLIMQTKQTVPGQRSEIRLREEIKGTVIGAVTARIQEVAPFDCDWVTKVSVEAFADLALKYKISSAKKVNQLFVKAISNRICCGKKELMKVLSEAISLEEDILKHLPRDVNPDAGKRFGSGIEELKKSIKTGKVKAAIRAQGLISEAARGLLVK